MNQTSAQGFESANPLQQIHENMPVLDRDGKEIGKVDRVYMSDASPRSDERGEGPVTAREPRQPRDSWVDDIANAFNPDEVPDELRERLLRNGFIRISSSGLFTSDRYAMPDQIASVSDDQVKLNTTRDELIKR